MVLNLVNTNQILVSDKFKDSDTSFKYFIDFKDDNTVRPLFIMLLQMSGYVKYFDNGEKMCPLLLKMIAYWLNIMIFGI